MRDYKRYDTWKISHELVKEIYLISENFPKSELFGLTSQIRRASISIPTNIAEGCGRSTDKEFARFLEISIGSTNETEYLLLLAYDLGFTSEDQLASLNPKLNLIRQKLIQLRKKLLNNN
ncbi:four helix bundle protein [Chryseobacterium sp. JJR-5R]|uniref:four helix bundle protein n=1 Tax=Chryseobacterium sp. JJR-5R TaxID=3093923 RepID=UPI002A7658CC|nr:four helix bundle protein [Chryseobacterium sp. JJR-5R]WPO82246.1 four helix bundle protein [Chryseobacterium sp. JJR-5R]